MIKIDTIGVWGFEGGLRGMRNPYESHERSDSKLCGDIDCDNCPLTSEQCNKIQSDDIVIGENDMTLAKKLIKGGSEHRKFLRMIHVQADITAPRYWWAEAETYQYLLHDPMNYVRNSSSTMHLITKKYLSGHDLSIDNPDKPSPPMQGIIDHINRMIEEYNSDRWSDEEKQTFFMVIKECLPESYNQLRTIDTNYECLLNIYHQRHAHRLPEWRGFSEWIKSLPYMEEFIGATE